VLSCVVFCISGARKLNEMQLVLKISMASICPYQGSIERHVDKINSESGRVVIEDFFTVAMPASVSSGLSNPKV
jgi:hypothetical protein